MLTCEKMVVTSPSVSRTSVRVGMARMQSTGERGRGAFRVRGPGICAFMPGNTVVVSRDSAGIKTEANKKQKSLGHETKSSDVNVCAVRVVRMPAQKNRRAMAGAGAPGRRGAGGDRKGGG
jgi:hypothetical protein